MGPEGASLRVTVAGWRLAAAMSSLGASPLVSLACWAPRGSSAPRWTDDESMAWLPIYIDENDAGLLLDCLNSDAEIAFIVSDGDGRWVARSTLAAPTDERFCLWHVPSGPLPLVRPGGAVPSVVADPWGGWSELRSGADPTRPYFGPGHPGIIWWNIRTKSYLTPGALGMSSFEWIGNHYRIIGSAADQSTERWWAGLRKLVRKMKARRIPRSGPIDGPHPEIWALPSAMAKIHAGMPRDNNP